MPNNKFNAQDTVLYLQSGTVDPRVTPLDSVGGTLYVLLVPGGYTLLQKQDDGVTTNWIAIPGGGGGGGTPVVLADPGAPILNQQWILRTPPSGIIGLSGAAPLAPLGGVGNFVINATPLTLAEKNFFSQGGNNWQATFDPKAAPFPLNTITVVAGPSPSGLDIQFRESAGFPTAIQLVNAINAWAAANLSVAHVIASLSNPADNGVVFTIPAPFTMALASSGVSEAYVLKIQGSTKVFTTNFG